MAEATVSDSSRDFWYEVNCCKIRKQTPAICVDGVLGDDRIVELWAPKFRDLFTSTDPHAHKHLAEKLSVLDITAHDLETLEIFSGAVMDSIKKLKRGKVDGGDLLSDHLIFSPCSFVVLLAPIITSLLRHGYMPPCFSDALVQPITKGNNKDFSQTANYRGIALTSCFSKVIELCVLEMYGECLLTSELQFGFKPGLSTTMCTGVLKAVVSR